MFCPKCGAQLPDGSAFCNLCGAQLNAVNVPPSDVPPSDVPYSANAPTGVSSRSAIAYFILAFFLGRFGAHNFYIGKTGLAVIQLVVSFVWFFFVLLQAGSPFSGPVGCLLQLFFGLPTLAIAIWAFVEGILGLAGKVTDAEGLPLAK